MIFTNKHIVLILLILIIVVFIYNYDVYVVPKNEPLCKPIYLIKRELTPDQRAKLNKSETVMFQNALNVMGENDFYEGFESTELNLPSKNIVDISIEGMTDADKIKVMDSVLNILSNIPTPLTDKELTSIIRDFGKYYNDASNIEDLVEKIQSESKFSEYPYNSKYANLCLYLIGKIHLDNENYKANSDQVQNLQLTDKEMKEIKDIEDETKNVEKIIKIVFEKNNNKNKNKEKSKNYYSENKDLEETKNLGGVNLNNGPSPDQIDTVDRTSQATRINTHSNNNYYEKEFGNIGIDSSYSDRYTDYLTQEMNSMKSSNNNVGSFNSSMMASNYLGNYSNY